MTLNTHNVFFQLVGFDDSPESPLIKSLDSLEEILKGKFKGTYKTYIVKPENPEMEF